MLRPRSRPYLVRFERSLRPCLAASIARLATGVITLRAPATTGDATRAGVRFSSVSSDSLRRSIPNALTILRFAAIPVFAWLYLAAGDGAAWGAGLFFVAAALTDQLDGFLARRWHVESRFGTIADPLADRLMIGTAAVLMWATGRLPLVAAAIVLARDLVLVLGYKLLAPRGFELEVSFLGKLATWILYAGLGLLLFTAEGTAWPLVIVWLGIALALGAAVQYALRARALLAGAEEPMEGNGAPRANHKLSS
jgi:CDP-diacylglycerol--glycerol-3-phosphate 3-phosphatidyltransferase